MKICKSNWKSCLIIQTDPARNFGKGVNEPWKALGEGRKRAVSPDLALIEERFVFRIEKYFIDKYYF